MEALLSIIQAGDVAGLGEIIRGAKTYEDSVRVTSESLTAMFVSLKDLKDRILNPNPHIKKSLIEQLNRNDAFRLKLKKTAVMFYKQNNTP